MFDIDRIISLIDSYLEMKGLEYVEPNEVSKFLERDGVLSYSTKGQPLRKLLREGRIPNAFKTPDNRWWIGHSNKKCAVNARPLKEAIDNSSLEDRVNCLSPIADAESKILILGSLPGAISLQKCEYYASPGNLFWRIIADLFNEVFPQSYNEKVSMLKKHHIALWDVLRSANRKGSLDVNIEKPIPNDIAGFVLCHPSLQVIAFNGREAEEKFKEFTDVDRIPKHIRIITLPSSSQTYARLSLDEKTASWSYKLGLM